MFTLDLRGLAMMRIVLGCALLRDLSIIGTTLLGLFGDQSVMPPAMALTNFFEQNYRSIHTLSGATGRQIFLFIVQCLATVCFLFGYQVRYITPLLRFLLCSQQGANPLITNGGDSIARLLLLWSCFLPIARVWSMDASAYISPPDSYRIKNIATIGLIIQMIHIYFRSYFLKTDPIWRSQYTATYYALSLDMFVKTPGLWLYQFPKLMERLTYLTLRRELLGGIIYLIPQKYAKILACLGFILFHIGLTSTMYLGAFPWYAIAGWIGLLPSIVRESSYIRRSSLYISSCFDVIKNGIKKILPSTIYIRDTLIEKPLSKLTSIFLIFVIGYCFMRNLRTIDFGTWDDIFPTSINRFGFLLRMDQYWAMFAPYPKLDDGRYNITGITEYDKKRANVTHPGVVPFDTKPTHQQISTIVPHEKRRKLVDNLWQKSNSQYRVYFAQYLCREYNASATKYTRIKTINISYMQENTKLEYQTDVVVPVDLGTRNCE